MELVEALVSQYYNLTSLSAQHCFLLPSVSPEPLNRSCLPNAASESFSWRTLAVIPLFSLYRLGDGGSVRLSHLLTKGYKSSRVVRSGFEPTNFNSRAKVLTTTQSCFNWPPGHRAGESSRMPGSLSPLLTASCVNHLCCPSWHVPVINKNHTPKKITHLTHPEGLLFPLRLETWDRVCAQSET